MVQEDKVKRVLESPKGAQTLNYRETPVATLEALINRSLRLRHRITEIRLISRPEGLIMTIPEHPFNIDVIDAFDRLVWPRNVGGFKRADPAPAGLKAYTANGIDDLVKAVNKVATVTRKHTIPPFAVDRLIKDDLANASLPSR